MTPQEFCYWLQGHLELSGEGIALTSKQTECIRRHLALVFEHVVDPSYTAHLPSKEAAAVQTKLSAIHGNMAPPPDFDPTVRYRC